MNKETSLESAITQIHKQHGRGSIMLLGSGERLEVEIIPTGVTVLDTALGVGGVPRGRIIEAFGGEASGKTTLALHLIAQAQKLGGTVAFIDAEHALDPSYAAALGVDTHKLYISQPDSGEEALEIVDALTRSGAITLIVIDSVAALVPRAELEGEMGDPQMALQARLLSQAMRKLCAVASSTKTTLFFINQVRQKIGVFFGNPETTTGGRALKFYSSLRLEIKRTKAIKKGEEVIGAETKIKVMKNKMASPYKEVLLPLLYGRGFVNEE